MREMADLHARPSDHERDTLLLDLAELTMFLYDVHASSLRMTPCM